MKKQAFTLVELIVVITILAILGTIGFINLQGFSSSSRDSKRISELSEISTGLQIYQAKNSLLPEPSDSITIGSGSTIYIIQGYAGESVLNEIKMNGDSKDPLEKDKFYTYSTNGAKTKFQLLALLENNQTSYNVISTTYANYETRKPYVMGYELGTLLESTTKVPLQELGNNIDLSVDTNEYLPIFTRFDNTTYSGSSLAQEMENRIGGTSCGNNGNCEGPQGGSFTINSSAITTNSTSVTLNVTCPTEYMGSTLEVAFGNTTNPDNWISCTETILHELTTGDGEKTVYVKFRDSYGNESSEVNYNINLTLLACNSPLKISKTTYGGWGPNAEIQEAIRVLPQGKTICIKSSNNNWNGYGIEFIRNSNTINGVDWGNSTWYIVNLTTGEKIPKTCTSSYCFRQIYGTSPGSHNNSFAGLYFNSSGVTIWHPGCGTGPIIDSNGNPNGGGGCYQNVDFHRE